VQNDIKTYTVEHIYLTISTYLTQFTLLSCLDGMSVTDAGILPKQDEKFPYKHFIPARWDELFL
jgi:hypothetical protein